MMVMKCFCYMIDWQRAISLISSRDHFERSSPSWISDMLWGRFEPAQNLSSGSVEWSCAVVITTTSCCQNGSGWEVSTRIWSYVGVPQGSILSPTLFPISMTFLIMLSVILLFMLIILLCTLSMIRHLICGNN